MVTKFSDSYIRTQDNGNKGSSIWDILVAIPKPSRLTVAVIGDSIHPFGFSPGPIPGGPVVGPKVASASLIHTSICWPGVRTRVKWQSMPRGAEVT